MRVPTHQLKRSALTRLGLVLLLGGSAGCSEIRHPSRIEISPQVYRSLHTNYQEIQVGNRREFFFCLLGEVIGNTVFVDSLTRPKIDYSSLISVHPSDNACRMSGVVGWTHSHPTREQDADTLNCYHSDEDWGYWRPRQRRYLVAIVVCENLAFNSYFRWEIPQEELSTTRAAAMAAEPVHIPPCYESYYVIMC